MYRRSIIPFPFYINFSSFSSFKPKSIHSHCKSWIIQQNNETLLESHLESILQACSDHYVLGQGKQIHTQFIVNEITNNVSVGAKIMGMYILCGRFRDAWGMFFRLNLGSTMPWNWMIRVLVRMGWYNLGLLFYFKMLSCKILPDKYTFPSVIKACNGLNNVRLGKLVHDTIREMDFEIDVFAGSSLVKLYSENGFIEDARNLFDKMSQKDCVFWNVMLNGYAIHGKSGNAINGFKEMIISEIKPNSVTFACILSVCAADVMADFGTQLHGLVLKHGLEFDSSVGNTLLTMYSKCGRLSDALILFSMMPTIDLVTYNGMISGHVQNGKMGEAVDLFREMISKGVKPDSITFSSFLPSVTEIAGLRQSKEIHGYILRNSVPLDVFLKGTLIDIYFKCRDVKTACNIFNSSSNIDIVICTAMISGYVLNNMNSDALWIFRWLVKEKMSPNHVTLASVLPACAGLANLRLGKELHANIIKNGLNEKSHVGSAITDMYAKCGRMDLAQKAFRRINEKDSVCWNSMITGSSQNGKPEESIDLFRDMVMGGTEPDCVSISAALSACANLPALNYGKEIHGFMIKGSSFSYDIFAESALIDMYSKCGNLNFARTVFDMMQVKNEVSWNSIIAAYGSHGLLNDCFTLFDKMLENDIQPDHVTFLAIISACGHSGQVDSGIHYFHLMIEKYRIPARMEHYASMVDLFGRAGQLDEAYKTIKSMPFSPDAGIWGTLLGACRIHGNVELAELASRHLFDLEPQNSGYYVLAANIHADAGQWGSVLKIRSLMKNRGVQKVPGYSWIEVNNSTHMFLAADDSHAESAQLYTILKSLLLELKKEGYVPRPYLPVHPQTLEMKLHESVAVLESNIH